MGLVCGSAYPRKQHVMCRNPNCLGCRFEAVILMIHVPQPQITIIPF